MCCPMRKNSLAGNERFIEKNGIIPVQSNGLCENKIEQERVYVVGNTTVTVRSYFPSTGPTVTELLENVIRFEGRMAQREQDNSSDG